MSAELIAWALIGVYALLITSSAAVSAYYEGKRKGFLDGYGSGFEAGCVAGEFKALCSLIERDMNESGDDE